MIGLRLPGLGATSAPRRCASARQSLPASRGGPAPRHPEGTRGLGKRGPVRAEHRRSDQNPDAAARATQAIRPVLAVDRMDDAVIDDQCRRDVIPRARRGCSCFLRHWIYGEDGKLVVESPGWWTSTTRLVYYMPWGAYDSEAVVTNVESVLERRLSGLIMHGRDKPAIRKIAVGETLMTQGEAETQVYLILDGMFVVEVDGRGVAEIGPGAVVGERAAAAGGVRTATLRATTRGRVAEASQDVLDALDLDPLVALHKREEAEVSVIS